MLGLRVVHAMSMQIGFFLHIPWPSSEIYRTLPWRKELLLGVLSSSLIGFQTHDYSRHFQSACTRIVGATCSNEVRPCQCCLSLSSPRTRWLLVLLRLCR